MGYFDSVWKRQGSRGLKLAFKHMLHHEKDKLAARLADAENSFPVIYLLAEDAENNGMENYFIEDAKYALWLTALKDNDDARCAKYAALLPSGSSGEPEPPCRALRWMLLTGCGWDGPSAGRDSFNAAIDLAAAYYTSCWSESDVLRKVAKLMFRRNRQGLFVHDLVWAFFRTANAEALSEIATYILSDNSLDRSFACTLLDIDEPRTKREREDAFSSYSAWLSENRPYIYVTDESFNAESVPVHLSLDREAKLVHHEIDPRTRAPLTPFTDDELHTIEVFRTQCDRGEAV